MKTDILKKLTALFFIICLFFGCTNPQDASENPPAGPAIVKDVDLQDLNWFIDNDPNTSGPCKIYLSLSYEGDFSENDVEYARVYYQNDNYWDLTQEPNYLNNQTKKIGALTMGRLDFNNVYALPLGPYKAEIKLTNGKISVFQKTLTIPGKNSNDNYDYIYTEDCTNIPENSTPALKRAIPGTYSKDNENNLIVINFSVHDSNVFNGFIQFYDIDHNWIGITRLFRNYSGNIDTFINDGTTINTDGDNSVELSSTDIMLLPEKSIVDITEFTIILTDGEQYSVDGKYGSYNYRSLSQRLVFLL